MDFAQGAEWHRRLRRLLGGPDRRLVQPVNFIIHRGDNKDPGPDESFIPAELPTVWKQSGDEAIYPSRGAAEDFATIHYHRDDGDYGDNTSPDFNDFWGMHVWDGALNPNRVAGPGALERAGRLRPGVRGRAGGRRARTGVHHPPRRQQGPRPRPVPEFDEWGYEVWQLSGGADPEKPYVYPIVGEGAAPGNIDKQQAYWVAEDTIAWAAGGDPSLTTRLYYAPDGRDDARSAVDIEGGSLHRP